MPPAPFAGEDLTCIRGERLVFTRLSFALHEGDGLILLGPNGSGKSSLLRVMAGLLKPFAGRLAWQGRTVAEDREAHAGRVHYLGHHDAVKPVLSVAENLRFWAQMHGEGAEGRARLALERFGLTHLAEMPGKLLSAGQKRRLNLARLLAAPARLWLLDEPSVALDRGSVRVLEQVIAEHRASGGMVVLSTHADILVPEARVLQMEDFAPDLAWESAWC